MAAGFSLNNRELAYKAGAGLIGGAIGWLPVEIASHGHSLTEAPTVASQIATYLTMAILAGLIGGMVNAAEAQTLQINDETKQRFVKGFVICLLLSLPTTYYANSLFAYLLAAGGWGVNQAGSIAGLIGARTISWALMGLMLGAGVGLATFSLRNAVKGAIGGCVGGFVAGLVFDPIGLAMSATGLMSRLVGFSVTGLAIGLFIGLVQELTKLAWLTVDAGRLRGRQFRIEQAITTIGKAEENVVGLFGDPGVAARHAQILKQGEAYQLKSLNPQQGVFVNGARIETTELHDGDRIKIGNYEMTFHLRAPAAPAIGRAPALARTMPSPQPSAQAGGPCLVGTDGTRFILRHGAVIRLGRALDNDIVLTHPSVSRHHAQIVSRNGSFEVLDLSSRNGTYVDGQRVNQATIASGNAVRLGDVEFVFRA
jgi:pSer/pThr/pTyr-binding forkhead associated (FHA) protein/type III secretory pathway component EscS